MISTENIHSLSDFQRNSKTYIRRMEKTGNPEVLTVNGEAKVVMLDAATFQRLIEKVDQADAVLTIRKRIAEAEAGDEGLSLDEAFKRLDKKFKKTRNR